MLTDFQKQVAVCEFYRNKMEFWQRLMWPILVAMFVASVASWRCIWGVLVTAWIVVFIPMCVRLWQYGREVDKLGEC